MSVTSKRSQVILSGALFLGGLITGWLAKSTQVGGKPPTLELLANNETALKNEAAQWKRLNAELVAATTASTSAARNGPREAPVLNRLRTVIDLTKSGVLQAGLSCVDRQDHLTKACVSLFELTPAEQNALQAAITHARDSESALELANAKVDILSDGSQKITVQSFPEVGGAVYDDLLKDIGNILGQERAAGFVALAMPQLDSSFNQYGAGDRTLIVKALPPLQDGGLAYSITEEFKGAGETHRKTMEVFDPVSLRIELGGIAKLVQPVH